jgi:hypothetical protein
MTNKLKQAINKLDDETEIQEENELKKKENPLNTLKDIIDEKKDKVERNSYSKSVPLARYNDIEKLGYLESIYNMLRDLNERVENLEKKN